MMVEVLIMVAKVVALGTVLFVMTLPLTWIERKVAGHIQVRLGPFRVGWHGLLQPIADMIKMTFKEDIVPDKADKFVFKIAPLMALAPLFAAFVVVPLGVEPFTIPLLGIETRPYITDMNVGVVYVLAISGLSLYGIIYGGWASNSKYSLLGGMRAAAQMISYEVAMSFAVIGVVMLSGSLSLVSIVTSQAGGIFNWNVFYMPVGPVWFAIFFIAGVAEANRLPFDLVEDEGTLCAGFHTEYSAMRFSFFALGEYTAMVSISVLSVLLFFGGWDAPIQMPPWPILSWPVFWLFLKVAFFIYFFMWIRFTFPRYRYDQLMTIGWKLLIPLSLVTLLVTGFLKIL